MAPIPTILRKDAGRKSEVYVLTEEKKALVENNMGFLWHYFYTQLVPRYSMLPNADMDELFSVLTLSICRAAEKWNPERGKFTTCAYWYFRSGISKYFREKQKYNSNVTLVGSYDNMKFVKERPSISWDSLIQLFDMAGLTEVEKKIVILKTKYKFSCEKIGEVIGKTKQRVHQIYKIIEEKLKNFVTYNDIDFDDFFC